MNDHTGRETVDQKDNNHMRSFFVAAVASFAVTATLCAISAVTVWLWHLEMGRTIGLQHLSASASFFGGKTDPRPRERRWCGSQLCVIERSPLYGPTKN